MLCIEKRNVILYYIIVLFLLKVLSSFHLSVTDVNYNHLQKIWEKLRKLRKGCNCGYNGYCNCNCVVKYYWNIQ